LLLNNGKQLMLGDSPNVVHEYYLVNQQAIQEIYRDAFTNTQEEQCCDARQSETFFIDWEIREQTFFDLSASDEITNGKVRFIRAGMFDQSGRAARVFQQGEDAFFYAEIEVLEDIMTPSVGVLLRNQRNIVLHGKTSVQSYCSVPRSVKKGSIIRACEKITLNLEQGEITVEMGVTEYSPLAFAKREDLPHEELDAAETKLCTLSQTGVFLIVQRYKGHPTRLTHHGICDLPTDYEIYINTI